MKAIYIVLTLVLIASLIYAGYSYFQKEKETSEDHLTPEAKSERNVQFIKQS